MRCISGEAERRKKRELKNATHTRPTTNTCKGWWHLSEERRKKQAKMYCVAKRGDKNALFSGIFLTLDCLMKQLIHRISRFLSLLAGYFAHMMFSFICFRER